MRTGAMRHRITIQKLIVTNNQFNELKQDWIDEETIWAEIKPLKGHENFKTNGIPQVAASVDVYVRIRHRPGLNPGGNRMVHKGIVYDIIAIIPDNWGKDMQLMLKALSTQQPDGGTVNV